jgi:hypothetical protein
LGGRGFVAPTLYLSGELGTVEGAVVQNMRIGKNIRPGTMSHFVIPAELLGRNPRFY